MNLSEWRNHEALRIKNGFLTQGIDSKIVDSHGFIDAYGKFYKNIVDRPSNSYIELANYRKYAPVVMQYCESMAAEIDRLRGIITRFETDSEDKSHKRWTKEEDELLIELVCRGESMPLVSAGIGRTVVAIKQRLSYLVGVKRLSQQIAGRFIGEINGEQTEASIVGTIYKGEQANG